MVYSKFLKQSNFLIGRGLKSLRFSYRNELSHALNAHNSVAWGASIHLNNCNYSTILNSKFSESQKPLRFSSSLNFAASISTDGSSDTYKIVITNPSEGTSTTLNSSLDATNTITNVEAVPQASPFDLTDVAPLLTEELSSVADVVEPSLASLGLVNWTPVGLVQMLLEQVHIGMHWPWWITIVATTVAARILLFPILLKTQKNAIEMSNHMPQLQFLQMKFGESRRTGNTMEASKYAHEMMTFMKEKNINPLKNAIWPMMQAPVFLSFFLALRAMAKVPVESMKDGGIWWFTDLTIPDPYYIMPLVACGTLYIVLKVGAESGIRLENMKMARYFVQALPVIALPFTINFPAAVLCYWVTNNFMTLGIVSLLKIQPIRLFFNLPTQQTVDPKFQLPKKGFIKGMKDAYEDQKVLGALEDRRRFDDVRFQKAGTGPIPRTYSYDPTKPRPSTAASVASRIVSAKKRDV